MVALLRVVGIGVVILSVASLVATGVIVWRTVVSEKRDDMHLWRDIYFKGLLEKKDVLGGGFITHDRQIEYLDRRLEAEGEYKKAAKLFFFYVCGMVAGTFLPVGFGLFLCAAGEALQHLRNMDDAAKA